MTKEVSTDVAPAAAPPAAFDLAALDTVAACEKGFELELKHPITEAPTGVFIGLKGKDSPTFKKYVQHQSNDRLRKQFERQRKGKDAEAPKVQEIEASAIDLLVTCTTHWRTVTQRADPENNIEEKSVPTVTIAGQVLTFSEENCREVYTRFPIIREQVDEGIGDLENFISA